MTTLSLRLKSVFILSLSLILISCGFKPTQTTEAHLSGADDSSRALEFAKRIPCKMTSPSFVPVVGVPTGPDLKMTPGKLCNEPNRRRYPENIAYCDRSVGGFEKDNIFTKYISAGKLNDRFDSREGFKVDHVIPLCAGGSNDEQNLWPQHESIGQFTDPVEPRLCALMAQGKIKQAEAVKIIQDMKKDYKTSGTVCQTLSRRLGI